MRKWTDQEIIFIIQKKEETDWTWAEIGDAFEKKFKENVHSEAIRKCYQRNKDLFLQKDHDLKLLKDVHRSKKNNSYRAKENRTILQSWIDREDLLDQFKLLLEQIKLSPYKVPKSLVFKSKDNKTKDKMTMELLLSDIHYGKLIKDDCGNTVVSCDVIRKRIKKVCDQVVKEIKRNSVFYDVERMVIGILGDIIESSHMHGEESLMGCEFGTSRQMNEAIVSIYHDLLIPISLTGLPCIDIVCVTGNHDRLGKQSTYVKPGENNLTYVIYKQLELLCQVGGLKNIKFSITSKMFTNTEIYGSTIVYEHGNELSNLNRDTMMKLMNKRQAQIGKIVDFYRVGHWHERVEYGQGKVQVNGSVPGQDDYSEGKGFDSEALQMLNYYIKTNKRRTSFFRSFPIYLEEKSN
ncbi:MAG TPA: hypothetical protein VI911_11625 [Patescibacteria group bacterium]|nr:hypothetical protein [Patescibacteria group bacterium]